MAWPRVVEQEEPSERAGTVLVSAVNAELYRELATQLTRLGMVETKRAHLWKYQTWKEGRSGNLARDVKVEVFRIVTCLPKKVKAESNLIPDWRVKALRVPGVASKQNAHGSLILCVDVESLVALADLVLDEMYRRM